MFEFLARLFFPCQCYDCRKERGELTREEIEEDVAQMKRRAQSGRYYDDSGDYHWPC